MLDQGWLKGLRKYSECLGYSCYGGDLKKEKIRLLKFDYQEAFEIGSLGRNFANEWFPGKPVIIDISLRNGHCLFRIITGTGSMPDDDNWIKRNRETAMRFGCSSFEAGRKCQERLVASEGIYYDLESKKYCFFDGGALPIFIHSCEYPVACLTVSGLNHSENHWLAVESVRQYIIRLNDSAGKYTMDSSTGKHLADCAICFSEVHINERYPLIPCKHIFHQDCFYYFKWYNSQCPVCRSPLKDLKSAVC